MIAIAAVAAMAAAQAQPPVTDAAQTLAAARSMYEQSCQVRAYGAYDDLCNALKRQVKEAEKAARKARDAKPAPVSTAPAEGEEPAPAQTASQS